MLLRVVNVTLVLLVKLWCSKCRLGDCFSETDLLLLVNVVLELLLLLLLLVLNLYVLLLVNLLLELLGNKWF